VVVCVADAAACDAVAVADASAAVRVAPDEVMLVGAPGDADEIARDAASRAAAIDPDALVLDVSDGWAALTLEGDDVHAAFSRLSPLRLPERGFVQGDVARVPAKVVIEPERLLLLVPSMWGEHLRSRIVERCSALGIREVEPG
jgi:sarcosine oxidase gamma subunit